MIAQWLLIAPSGLGGATDALQKGKVGAIARARAAMLYSPHNPHALLLIYDLFRTCPTPFATQNDS